MRIYALHYTTLSTDCVCDEAGGDIHTRQVLYDALLGNVAVLADRESIRIEDERTRAVGIMPRLYYTTGHE